ncbi:MAG: replicative DNA helicase [Pseudohongiellaceae bacterium]|jgi:replicative DNA helicase
MDRSLMNTPRLPPQNVVAEVGLLGCLMHDNTLIWSAKQAITPEDFFQGQNRVVFETMLRLADDGQPLDLTTLAASLKGTPAFESMGVNGLVTMMEGQLSGASWEQYARLVKDASDRRRLLEVAERIQLAVNSDPALPGQAVEKAEALMHKALAGRHRNQTHFASKLMPEIRERIDSEPQEGHEQPGVLTGFTALDRQLGVLAPGSSTILAGRPSMGKSTLAMSIADNVAVRGGKSVLIFTLEVEAEQLLTSISCGVASVSARDLKANKLSNEDYLRWVESSHQVDCSRIAVDDTPGLTTSQMRANAQVVKGQQGLDLIIVDYLQLLRSDQKAFSREREVSDISSSLKQMARETGVPVLALSQLSRGPETRRDKRPTISDLRDSGSIEQDADAVLLMYRDGYYKSQTATQGETCEVLVVKNRHGPTGKVELTFFPEWARFENFTFHIPPSNSPGLPPAHLLEGGSE